MDYRQYEEQRNQYLNALAAQQYGQNSLAAALGNSPIQQYQSAQGVPIKLDPKENKMLLLLEA